MNMQTIQFHRGMMLYALDADDKLVHVDSVPNGLECGCTCPACHGKMIAKNGGDIYRHHFAHDGGEECQNGIETSLHILAKEIIAKGISVRFPATFFTLTTCWNQMIRRREYRGVYKGMAKVALKKISNTYRISDEIDIKPDSVKLEYRVGNVIPDVVLEWKGRPLIVEIFVSHAVDQEKKQKLKKLGIPAIEINLSEIDRDVDEEFLTQAIKDGRFTEWVHAPRRDAIEDKYIELLKNPWFLDPARTREELQENDHWIDNGKVEDPPCAEHSKFKTGEVDGLRVMPRKWCRDCPFCMELGEDYVICCRDRFETDMGKDLYRVLGLYKYEKTRVTDYEELSECHVSSFCLDNWMDFSSPFRKSG